MINKKLIQEFKRIQSLGFIRSNRSHNTGIGKTFEDYLGVQENNLKDSDFEGFEIKSQRFLSLSKITLFTKSPSAPDRANSYLRENFGYLDNKTNSKIIHTSFFGNRYNSYLNQYSFKLEINRIERKIYLIVKNHHTDEIINDKIYYTFDDLLESIKKLERLFVVTANAQKRDEIEYFHFTKARIFLGFNFEKFLDLIEIGKIQYDIRIGVYKSGKYIGRQHDHGSGFRIFRDNIKDLFNEIIDVD